MFFEEKLIMLISIKEKLSMWLIINPKSKEWFWFIFLWVSGLLSLAILTYPLKFLMNQLR